MCTDIPLPKDGQEAVDLPDPGCGYVGGQRGNAEAVGKGGTGVKCKVQVGRHGERLSVMVDLKISVVDCPDIAPVHLTIIDMVRIALISKHAPLLFLWLFLAACDRLALLAAGGLAEWGSVRSDSAGILRDLLLDLTGR